jgi:Fe2+ transport system protein FeoA
MQLSLDKGKIGCQYIVRSVQNDLVASRLMAMGVRAGANISIIRKTWLSRAICIKTEGLVIALRQNEATAINVENLSK